jgi:hypothetical protein
MMELGLCLLVTFFSSLYFQMADILGVEAPSLLQPVMERNDISDLGNQLTTEPKSTEDNSGGEGEVKSMNCTKSERAEMGAARPVAYEVLNLVDYGCFSKSKKIKIYPSTSKDSKLSGASVGKTKINVGMYEGLFRAQLDMVKGMPSEGLDVVTS